jgi:hypothetical protein
MAGSSELVASCMARPRTSPWARKRKDELTAEQAAEFLGVTTQALYQIRGLRSRWVRSDEPGGRRVKVWAFYPVQHERARRLLIADERAARKRKRR